MAQGLLAFDFFFHHHLNALVHATHERPKPTQGVGGLLRVRSVANGNKVRALASCEH